MKRLTAVFLTALALCVCLALPVMAQPNDQSRITYDQKLTPHHDVTLTEYRQITGTARVWSQWTTMKPWNWDKISASDKQVKTAVLHYVTDTITGTVRFRDHQKEHNGYDDAVMRVYSVPYSFSLKHSSDPSQLDWTSLPNSQPWTTTNYAGTMQAAEGRTTFNPLTITVLGSITTEGRTYRYTPVISS
jgi:hypothetical protein